MARSGEGWRSDLQAPLPLHMARGSALTGAARTDETCERT